MAENTSSRVHEKIVEEELKRRQGYEMIEKGMKNSVISGELHVDRRTVYNWRLRMEKDIDWKRRKQKGARSRLTNDQKEKLKKIIEEGALAHGYPTDLWTLKRMAEVIDKEFGVHYNTAYIWQILDSMGYSSQMPVTKAIEKDSEYVKKWLEKEYPEYVKEAKEHSATILFQDESGMQSSPNRRRTWSPRGKRPAIQVRGKRDRISISSAVTEDGDLYFMIVKESMNEDHTISFLDQLLSEINGFLYIFWDNIMIHRSKKVREYLGIHNDRMITRRIPPYSPELNPDEFVWNALKYQELPNFCPRSYDDLYSTAEAKLLEMKSHPEKLKRIIRGTSLPMPSEV